MRSISVVAVLFASCAFAQGPRVIGHGAGLIASQPGCPVSVSVQRVSAGSALWVSGPEAGRASYHVSLGATGYQTIRQAEIRLIGLSGPRMMRADADRAGYASEAFTLSPGELPMMKLDSDVDVKRLTGVRWIELESVTYSDGSVWKKKVDGACVVNAGGMLPVV